MINCSSSKKSRAIESYSFEIFFGNTGGFSNINPIFSVKNNGDVFKKNNATSDAFLLKKIEIPKIDSLYTLIAKSNFENLKINHISNLTHYIEIKSEKFTNKIMWHENSQLPDEGKKLYNFLLSTVKKQ